METPETGSAPPPDVPDTPSRSIPEPPRQRFPSAKQGLITFVGGFVLAATACLGFLASLNVSRGGNEFVPTLTAILFCVGLVAILTGVVFLIIRAVRGR